jgi:hypothetical protein
MQINILLQFIFNSLLICSFFSPSYAIESEQRRPKACTPQLVEISAKPQFRSLAGGKVAISSCAIKEIVQPLLYAHLAETNYDRIHMIEQFIDYYWAQKKKYPNISPLQALASFLPDMSITPYRGSSCYGLTDDLLSKLPKELQAIRVPSTVPEEFQHNACPQYGHSAIVIAFENPQDKTDTGYILLDPNFDIEVPVVLKNDGSACLVDMKELGYWSYACAGDTIECRECSNADLCTKSPPVMCYLLQEYLNPTEVCVKPLIASDRRISLVSRKRTGHQIAYLNVELDKKRVTSSIQYVLQKPIDFEDFLQGKGFDNDFAKLLFQKDSLTLNSLIKKVIENQELLDQLNKEYNTLITQCDRKEDFVFMDH